MEIRFGLNPKLLESIRSLEPLINESRSQPHYSGSWVYGIVLPEVNISNLMALFLFDMENYFPSFLYAGFCVMGSCVEKVAHYNQVEEDATTSSGNGRTDCCTHQEGGDLIVSIQKKEFMNELHREFEKNIIYVKNSDPQSWSVSSRRDPVSDATGFPSYNEVSVFSQSCIQIFSDWLSVFDFNIQLNISE